MAPAIRAGEAPLVERARRGDHEAFAALIDGRLVPTFRTALAILGNEADARDATQEIFLRVWRNLPELRDADHFAAWFGRIVVNTCRTAIRGRRRSGQQRNWSASPSNADHSARAPGRVYLQKVSSSSSVLSHQCLFNPADTRMPYLLKAA